MPTPDDLETQVTLRTAVRRYDELRYRDSLVDNPGGARRPGIAEPLSRAEALELVALSEVIARKAGHGRQLAVRTARATGASWAQIGEALGTSRQSAWEAHTRWIDHHAHRHHTTGYEGFDETEATQARALAKTRRGRTAMTASTQILGEGDAKAVRPFRLEVADE